MRPPLDEARSRAIGKGTERALDSGAHARREVLCGHGLIQALPCHNTGTHVQGDRVAHG